MPTMQENPNLRYFGTYNSDQVREHARIAVDHVNFLSDLCYSASFGAGWHSDPKTGELIERNAGEMLMLIVSEIAEAMEGHRKGLMDDKLPHRLMVEVELGDAVIRILDFAGRHGLDLGGAVAEKIAYNLQREDHKLENRLKPGGKAY